MTAYECLRNLDFTVDRFYNIDKEQAIADVKYLDFLSSEITRRLKEQQESKVNFTWSG